MTFSRVNECNAFIGILLGCFDLRLILHENLIEFLKKMSE